MLLIGLFESSPINILQHKINAQEGVHFHTEIADDIRMLAETDDVELRDQEI